MRDYPLFVPPPELAVKTPREWTKDEAASYSVWLQSHARERVDGLLRFFGIERGAPSAVLLRELGKRVTEALRSEQFSRGGILTTAGLALSADMGLLLAELLLKDCDRGLQWETVQKPRSDADFHQPILSGFGSLSFNPIGGSVAEAAGVLSGRRDGDAWLKAYEFWRARAI